MSLKISGSSHYADSGTQTHKPVSNHLPTETKPRTVAGFDEVTRVSTEVSPALGDRRAGPVAFDLLSTFVSDRLFEGKENQRMIRDHQRN